MSETPRTSMRWLVGGLLLGVLGTLGVLVSTPFAKRPQDVDRAEIRERAPVSDRELWQQEWDARAAPWTQIPDPPGDGPIERARYWVSHGIYDMEVRRRGSRVVVGISGIDQQVMGGGWAAFGEGTITPKTGAHPFSGCRMEIMWSCLGVRFRYASDGVGYLQFSDSGREVLAQYMAFEDPQYWAAAHGQLQVGDEPAWGSIHGQITLAHRKRSHFALAEPKSFRVRVTTEDGIPLAQATVQPKGNDDLRVITDEAGIAEFVAHASDFPVGPVVGAGLYGFRNGGVVIPLDAMASAVGSETPPRIELTMALAPMHTEDDERYVWQRSNPGHDKNDAMACGTCHEWQYQEWIGSRHALSNDNGHVRFVEAQIRLHSTTRVIDDCAKCHRPGHAAYEDASFSPRGPLAANHCDFCHKISHVGDVRESGVDALHLVRPNPSSTQRPGGIHQVFGPRADVTYAYMGAVQNPLFEASHLCAACHQGGGAWKETGLPKMNTFEEWRQWAAARPNESRSCQDCHMRGSSTRNDDDTLLDQLAWDTTHRTPGSLHNHRFEGTEPAFAEGALDVQVRKERRGARVQVHVSVRNIGAGHKVPTGSWTKHVVVGIWARQGTRWLALEEGPRAHLVDDTPNEPLAAGDWRNPAGFILGVRPVANQGKRFQTPFLGRIWPAQSIHDSRLSPGATATVDCSFEVGSDAAPVHIEVRVVHRRGAFGAKLEDVPWELRPRDPMPQVLWKRVIR